MDIDEQTLALFENNSNRKAWIIFQLSLQKSSLASVARDAGISRQAIWQTLVKPYPKVERIIAASLNMQPQTLFPERYGPDEKSNRKRGRPPK